MSVGFENTSAALAARDSGNDAGFQGRGAVSPAEQLAILDTLFNDKDFSQGFSSFIKDQENENGTTYNDMTDGQLLKCLSEFLGSGVANVSLNGAGIEMAQQIASELAMSDEELADLENTVSLRAVEAKQQKKEEDRAKDFYEAEAGERAERRAQWDEQMHQIGNQQYSGAELHAMNEWLLDSKNQEGFEQEIMARDGVSKEEAKRRRTELQELLALMEKQRNGDKLTSDEELRFNALENKASVQSDVQALKSQSNAGIQAQLTGEKAERGASDSEMSAEKRAAKVSSVPNVTSAQNSGAAPWSSSSSPIKVEEGISSIYNATAAGKVEPQKINAQSNNIVAQAVGISEPSPYG